MILRGGGANKTLFLKDLIAASIFLPLLPRNKLLFGLLLRLLFLPLTFFFAGPPFFALLVATGLASTSSVTFPIVYSFLYREIKSLSLNDGGPQLSVGGASAPLAPPLATGL